MQAPEFLSSKISNGLRYLASRPHVFVPPNIRKILEIIASRGDVTPESARDLLEWADSSPDIPNEILEQFVGKDKGRAWLKVLAKQAPPKVTPEMLLKEMQKKIDLTSKHTETKVVEKRVVSSGTSGSDGWTPVIANVEHNGGVYQQIVAWIGGTGKAPPVNLYIGPEGLVENISDATNIRGASGGGGGGGGFQNLFFQESTGTPTVPPDADDEQNFLLYQKTGVASNGDPIFHEWLWIPE